MADTKNEGGFAAFSKKYDTDNDNNDQKKNEVPRGEGETQTSEDDE